MAAARDRTLRIEEQLEAMGDELSRERANTVREKQKTMAVSAVRGTGRGGRRGGQGEPSQRLASGLQCGLLWRHPLLLAVSLCRLAYGQGLWPVSVVQEAFRRDS